MKIVFDTDLARRFTQSECCTTYYRRGRYYHAESFERSVSGIVTGPRHMSVGRFLRKDIWWIRPGTLCYLPWTFIECECGSLMDNLHATKTTIEVLDYHFDLKESFVTFSGNKSFWITIPSYVMGNPVGSVDDQKALRQRVFLPLMEYPVDENLWDARHLRRVIGSQHEKGGRVRAVPIESLFNGTWDKAVFHPHPPLLGWGCDALVQRAKVKTQFHVPPFEDIPREIETSSVMRETDGGVEEGERNYAAFRRACALIRRMPSQSVIEELTDWNTHNAPPLPPHELVQVVRSAERTAARYA